MTPDDIARVRSVISRLDQHPEFAERFYGRLFDTAPETRPMFGDPSAQRQKLTDELTAMVDLLNDLGALDDRARDLGDRHRAYGVRAAHYRLAQTVMLATLVDVLGDDLTDDDQRSWTRATSLITELMQTR